jgi:hypothetical protein
MFSGVEDGHLELGPDLFHGKDFGEVLVDPFDADRLLDRIAIRVGLGTALGMRRVCLSCISTTFATWAIPWPHQRVRERRTDGPDGSLEYPAPP